MAQASKTKSGKTAGAADSAKKAASTTSKTIDPTTAAREAAVAGTVAAGKAVAAATGKLKTPLLVGGATMAGIAGGAAIRNRLASSRSRGLGKRLRGVAMPKLDLDTLDATAERVGAYGRQIDEVASAVRRASQATKKGK